MVVARDVVRFYLKHVQTGLGWAGLGCAGWWAGSVSAVWLNDGVKGFVQYIYCRRGCYLRSCCGRAVRWCGVVWSDVEELGVRRGTVQYCTLRDWSYGR